MGLSGNHWRRLGRACHKDGLDGVHVHMTNTSNLPVEALEVEYPLTCCATNWSTVRAAPARFAAGWVCAAFIAPKRLPLRVDIARRLSAPWGLFGGRDGGKAEIVLRGGADADSVLRIGLLRKGEIIEVVTAGSGGYGPAEQRDRDAVRRDVSEGSMDADVARGIYG